MSVYFARCCSECQAIFQPNSACVEVVIDGERHELMLFGSRVKFFGESTLLHEAPIHVGYAEVRNLTLGKGLGFTGCFGIQGELIHADSRRA